MIGVSAADKTIELYKVTTAEELKRKQDKRTKKQKKNQKKQQEKQQQQQQQDAMDTETRMSLLLLLLYLLFRYFHYYDHILFARARFNLSPSSPSPSLAQPTMCTKLLMS